MADKVELAGPKVGAKDLSKEEVRRWFGRIHLAQKKMQRLYDIWDKRIDLYMASEGVTRKGGGAVEEIHVNLIPSTLQIVKNNLWTRNRQIFGKTEDQELEANILPALQARMRSMWRKLRPHRDVSKALTDALIMPRGFLKIGFDLEFFGGGVSTKDGRDIETNTSIRPGLPWLRRLSPRHVYVDPNATDLDDARWLVTVSRRPLSELQDNPAYSNIDEIGGADIDYEKIMGRDDVLQQQDDDRKAGAEDRMVILYEVQDKTTRTTFVLADGVKEKTVIPPLHDAMPFRGFTVESICFNDVPDEFWGISEVGQWEDHQRNLSELRERMLDFAKRLAWIWLAEEGSLTDEQKEKLISADSQTVIDCIRKDGIGPLPAAAMPAEFGMMEGIIQNDIRQISGVADFQRGSSPEARTATEANIIQQAQQGRGQPMRDEVTDFMDRVLGKMGTIMTTLMLAPGDEPIEEGEIEWRFDAPAAQAFSPEVRRKLWSDVVNLSMSVNQAQPGLLNLRSVMKRWMVAHDIQDIDEIIPPEASPGSGLTPDQENIRLAAGLPVQPSEDEDFMAHIRSHMELRQIPEIQMGKMDPSQIDAHIKATIMYAQAAGVQLPLEDLGLAPQGPMDGNMLRAGETTERSMVR